MGEEGRVASGMGEEGSNEGWVRRGAISLPMRWRVASKNCLACVCMKWVKSILQRGTVSLNRRMGRISPRKGGGGGRGGGGPLKVLSTG